MALKRIFFCCLIIGFASDVSAMHPEDIEKEVMSAYFKASDWEPEYNKERVEFVASCYFTQLELKEKDAADKKIYWKHQHALILVVLGKNWYCPEKLNDCGVVVENESDEFLSEEDLVVVEIFEILEKKTTHKLAAIMHKESACASGSDIKIGFLRVETSPKCGSNPWGSTWKHPKEKDE